MTEVDGATILMEIARQEGSTWPVDRSRRRQHPVPRRAADAAGILIRPCASSARAVMAGRSALIRDLGQVALAQDARPDEP